MKIKIVLPLFLGCLLAGCNRADSQKLAANDNNPGADKPATATATSNATANATATKDAMATAKDIADATPAATAAAAPSAAATPDHASPPAVNDMASNGAAPRPPVSVRLTEWKLTPEDIRSEVASGHIERTRTPGAGEPTGPMDDALVGAIKGKLQDNPDTASLKLEVTAEGGVVSLGGSAHSLDQIGTAIALSLDTPGVTKTVAQIKLESAP